MANEKNIFKTIVPKSNKEGELRKEEIASLLKTIDRKLKRYTNTDDEIIGEPDYLVSSKDLIPMSLLQAHDGTNALGGLSSSAIIEELDRIDHEKGVRLSRYKRLRKTIESPECEGILNIYADEATTEDQNGEIVHVFHKNKKVKERVQDLFRRCDIAMSAWQTIWNLCAYGDEVFDVIPALSGDRILKLQWVPRERLERVEENGILLGFKEALLGEDQQSGTMFATYKYVATKDDENAIKNDEDLIHPFRILHFRIPSDKFAPYGKSILDSIVTPIEQLNMLSKAMLISRVTRAPERRVFTIDVGNLMGEPAIKYAHDAVNTLKRKKQLEMNHGGDTRQDLVRDAFGATEDIIIPKRAGTEGNAITTLPMGTGYGDIADVEFLRDRIFPPVGVPRQYMFDDTFAYSSSNLSSHSVPFAKRIRRIQRFYLQQLYKLATIDLKIGGFSNEDIDELKLMMNNPSNIDENEKIDIDMKLWGLISSVKSASVEGVFYPDYLIYKNYLRMDDEEIVELLKLAQLQAAGENIFKFMPMQDRPEGAKDLADGEPDEGGGGGGMAGGGGGGGMFGGGGDDNGDGIPDEVDDILGEAPEGEAPVEPEVASILPDTTKNNSYLEAMDKKLQLIQKFNNIQSTVFNEVSEISKRKHAEENNNFDSYNQRGKTALTNLRYETLESSGELTGLDQVEKSVAILETEEKK